MRLLNFAQKYPEPGFIETERVILRRPQPDDFPQWAALRLESSGFLKPYEPTWSVDELSRSSFRARLRRHQSDIASGRGLPWFIFDRFLPQTLLGGITVSNIRRGVAQSGTLGYWMGEAHAGQGYMSEALGAVCQNIFYEHKLHRLEAATVIENKRSQRLLENNGFQQEGRARKYLKINGIWEDHILYARLATDNVQ